jgi:Arc/MetJ family transcription regulator
VSKRLIDIDDSALQAARDQLGTGTIKDTVNEALRRIAGSRQEKVAQSLDTLSESSLEDRTGAWR